MCIARQPFPTKTFVKQEKNRSHSIPKKRTQLTSQPHTKKVGRKNLSASRISSVRTHIHNSSSLSLGTQNVVQSSFRHTFFSSSLSWFKTTAAAACYYLNVEMCDDEHRHTLTFSPEIQSVSKEAKNNSERQGEKAKQPEDTSSTTAIA